MTSEPTVASEPAHGDPGAVVALDTRDGVRLAASALVPGRSTTMVVVAHGLAASKDTAATRAVAAALHSAGYGVITYDSRGHGSSGGDCTLGFAERYDVEAAAGLARSFGAPVLVVGASMGAIGALRAASGPAQIDGVVAVSTPARWRLPRSARGVVAALLTRTAPGRLLMRRHAGVRLARRWTSADEPLTLVERLAVPLAIVHGDRDGFISARDAWELRAAYPRPCHFAIVRGMGHGFDPASIGAIVAAVRQVVACCGPEALVLDRPSVPNQRAA